MPHHLQEFLVRGIQKAMEDFVGAVENLPADKRAWSPMDKGRSALNQAAEIAILNGVTASVIANRVFPADFDFHAYENEKAKLAEAGWDGLKPLIAANTEMVIAAVKAVPDEDLNIEIAMPWGPLTLSQIMAYPYWNMAYHEGQTNYINFIM